ncbi:hypothetical protein [Leisingera sp. F5]|uniref:hypothetical protein n=1 Tax=Leisingera sp. F5 TaxID=1813816 RepID=UPI000A5FC2E0|nr:hypothetical protein [Leisingera sp. F5]
MKYFIKWLKVYPRYRFTRYDVLVQRGIVATSLFLSVVLFLSLLPTCQGTDCQRRIVAFWYSPPNEIGDSLAGAAGALAFFWIIVTVMMQSKELSQQRLELRLARKESEKMAAQLTAQTQLFAYEEQRRKAVEAENLLHEYLLDAFLLMRDLSGAAWYQDKALSRRGGHNIEFNCPSEWSWEKKLTFASESYDAVGSILWRCEKGIYVPGWNCVHEVPQLYDVLRKIKILQPELSAVNSYRLERARFDSLLEAARLLAQSDVLWISGCYTKEAAQ